MWNNYCYDNNFLIENLKNYYEYYYFQRNV